MIEDFKTAFYRRTRSGRLRTSGKVQAGLWCETPLPYAAFTTPEETPLHTKHGIAGVQTLFEVALIHDRMVSAEALKRKAIRTLDGIALAGRRCRWKSSEYSYYADFDLHGYTITFKII